MWFKLRDNSSKLHRLTYSINDVMVIHLITRILDSSLIQDVQPDTYFSDHCSVLFSMSASKPHLSRKQVSFRKTKAIDTAAFMKDLSVSKLCQDPPSEPDKLVDC